MWGAATGSPMAGPAALANGSLARFFWRVRDALDHWLVQARLWTVDAVWRPEPETAAD
jgi:hypothetical protein